MALTLVELFVVSAIIGVLTAVIAGGSHHSRHVRASPVAGTGPLLFGNDHPGIGNFLRGHASVPSLQVNIDTDNLGRLAKREDGEVISVDF